MLRSFQTVDCSRLFAPSCSVRNLRLAIRTPSPRGRIKCIKLLPWCSGEPTPSGRPNLHDQSGGRHVSSWYAIGTNGRRPRDLVGLAGRAIMTALAIHVVFATLDCFAALKSGRTSRIGSTRSARPVSLAARSIWLVLASV